MKINCAKGTLSISGGWKNWKDTTTMVIVFPQLDSKGNAKLTGTIPSGLVGATVFAQALQKELSNAIAIRVSN